MISYMKSYRNGIYGFCIRIVYRDSYISWDSALPRRNAPLLHTMRVIPLCTACDTTRQSAHWVCYMHERTSGTPARRMQHICHGHAMNVAVLAMTRIWNAVVLGMTHVWNTAVLEMTHAWNVAALWIPIVIHYWDHYKDSQYGFILRFPIGNHY